MNNLNSAVKKIDGDTRKGLDSAAQFVMLESMSRAPEDRGHLKDSAFHKPYSQKNGFGETVGFNEEYAPYVHESQEKLKGEPRTRKGAKGHFWDQGESHFLEKAVLENFSTIINIIKKFAGRG
jgi:hypothetical protein